jgi:peptidoglycan hydrolase-like protein with peptidoglycan-binding domain
MLQSLLFFANERLERAAQNSPPLARGSQGDAVRCLQLALVAAGHSLPLSVKINPLSADGAFGSETEKAVRAFQSRFLLQADGIAGKQTISKLDELLRESGQDPLLITVKDLRRLGARLIQASINGPAVLERRMFEERLRDLDGLILGNPQQLAIHLKNPNLYV